MSRRCHRDATERGKSAVRAASGGATASAGPRTVGRMRRTSPLPAADPAERTSHVSRSRTRGHPVVARARGGRVGGVLGRARRSGRDGRGARRAHRVRVVRAVSQAGRVAVHARLSRHGGAHRRGPEGAVAALRLRAHVLGRPGPRPGAGDRAPLRDEGPARRLAVAQRSRERRGADARDPGREPRARRDPRDRRRQRGAAARRVAAADDRRARAAREGRDRPAGHVCRRVGVLAEVPRGRAGRRLHHDPHPAVLGGRADRDRPRDRARRRDLQADAGGVPGPRLPDRRDRLAERGPPALARGAEPRQRGPLLPRVHDLRRPQSSAVQRDRGVRPAVEALARRHRRRLLGPLRRRPARQIRVDGPGRRGAALVDGNRRRRRRRARVRGLRRRRRPRPSGRSDGRAGGDRLRRRRARGRASCATSCSRTAAASNGR